jgi:hypothetical protein
MRFYQIQKKEKLMINMEKRVLGNKKEVEIKILIRMIYLTNFSEVVVVLEDLEEVKGVDSIFNLILGEEVEVEVRLDNSNNSKKKSQTYFKIQVILKLNIF